MYGLVQNQVKGCQSYLLHRVVYVWVRSCLLNNDIHEKRSHISIVTSAGHMLGADYY